MSSGSSRERIEFIELLRFILSLGVVVFHYYYTGPRLGLVSLSPVDGAGFVYLQFAVEAFFVVSGFVIVLSTTNRTATSFLIARFARLGPTLLIASSITLATYYLLNVNPSIPRPIAKYLASITIVPLAQLAGLDGALWSLKLEVRFYLLIAACMLFVDVRKRALTIGIALLAYDAAGLMASNVFHGHPSRFMHAFDIYACYFALGMGGSHVRRANADFFAGEAGARERDSHVAHEGAGICGCHRGRVRDYARERGLCSKHAQAVSRCLLWVSGQGKLPPIRAASIHRILDFQFLSAEAARAARPTAAGVVGYGCGHAVFW
jgi:peptidoglycan/LPS O-acetylase OafA/YrhL